MRNVKLLGAILFTTAILTTACKKEPIQELSTLSSRVRFMDLSVGQKSQYVLFRGEDIKDDSNFNFEYIEDTLSIEIIAEDENGYLIQEYLTPGSISLNGENNVAFADSTWYYYVYEENNAIKTRQWGNYYRTRLFFLEQEEEKGLMLQNISSPQTEIKGWKTTLPFEKEYITAMTSEMNLLGSKYENLNILIENSNMHDGLPGYTHIFSEEHGLVRSTEYSDYTSKGYGWDLLPR